MSAMRVISEYLFALLLLSLLVLSSTLSIKQHSKVSQTKCFYGEDLAQVLKKYLRYRYPNHPALFTVQQPFTLEVTRLSYPAIYKDWTNLVHQGSELGRFRLHDLRHTFATERVGLMGIEELRALRGHTNIQTTLRYQKVTSGRAEEVAKKALEVLVKI